MKSWSVTQQEGLSSFIKSQQEKDLLRFVVCGSVDDGKSTMIGRLLYDSKQIFDDQLVALERDSARHGTQGESIDFALLTDGLMAEREQGITIDVAYRFFATDKRAFIVADVPGHEQYTRNMVTGASTADLAVVLIDARKGVLTQTRRHSLLVDLLGIKRVVVAINKIDLVDYRQEVFESISRDYLEFAHDLHFQEIHFVPISALTGENLTLPSANMNWYQGPSLIEIAEKVPVHDNDQQLPFRMSVQSVNRPNPDFRGYMGLISSGTVSVGDAIRVLPSERESRVRAFADFDGPKMSAVAGESVCLLLEDEVDISRGDLLSSASEPASLTDHFEAHLVWFGESPMIPQRSYLLKIGSREVPAQIDRLKYRLDVDTNKHLEASSLKMNDIGIGNVSTTSVIAFDAYDVNRQNGAFILIDRATNLTVGAGMIRHGLRRFENVPWQKLAIGREQRGSLTDQKSFVLWLTGLSGSGKSTIANQVEQIFHRNGLRTYILDGDNVRHGLNADLGFSDSDRAENIRRVSEVAKLFVDAGVVTIVSFISPFGEERKLARDIVGTEDFFEVFVDAPLEVVEARDVKGLYAKARAGLIPNFTGINSPYEIPVDPDLRIDTSGSSIEECVQMVLQALTNKGLIQPNLN
jgi:bifunctional enzyme CysN/CysC